MRKPLSLRCTRTLSAPGPLSPMLLPSLHCSKLASWHSGKYGTFYVLHQLLNSSPIMDDHAGNVFFGHFSHRFPYPEEDFLSLLQVPNGRDLYIHDFDTDGQSLIRLE